MWIETITFLLFSLHHPYAIDMFNRITALVKSDRALPENPSAVQTLANKIVEVSQAPAPSQVPPLPNTAYTISGKTYELEQNFMGLQRISLEFPGGNEAYASLAIFNFLSGQTIDFFLPVGLDNVFRISPGRYDLPAGLKGYWETDNEFVLIIDEIGNKNILTLHMRFEGSQVTIRLKNSSDYEETFFGWTV